MRPIFIVLFNCCILSSTPAVAEEMWCWPLGDSGVILASPNADDIHPFGSVGTGWAFRAKGRTVTNGSSFLSGDLHSPRGGLIEAGAFMEEQKWTCDYPHNGAQAEIAPAAELRHVLAEYFERTLFDPYSVRAARITNFKNLEGPDGGAVYSACVEFNAKNRLGAYTGLQVSGVVFRPDSTMMHAIPEWYLEEECRGRSWAEFPELEKLGD